MTATNPDHYKQGGMEAIDVIEAYFPDQVHLANALKYMLRLGRKDSETQEVSKIIWYLLRYLKFSGEGAPDITEYADLLGYRHGMSLIDDSRVEDLEVTVNPYGSNIKLSMDMSGIKGNLGMSFKA